MSLDEYHRWAIGSPPIFYKDGIRAYQSVSQVTWSYILSLNGWLKLWQENSERIAKNKWCMSSRNSRDFADLWIFWPPISFVAIEWQDPMNISPLNLELFVHEPVLSLWDWCFVHCSLCQNSYWSQWCRNWSYLISSSNYLLPSWLSITGSAKLFCSWAGAIVAQLYASITLWKSMVLCQLKMWPCSYLEVLSTGFWNSPCPHSPI